MDENLFYVSDAKEHGIKHVQTAYTLERPCVMSEGHLVQSNQANSGPEAKVSCLAEGFVSISIMRTSERLIGL